MLTTHKDEIVPTVDSIFWERSSVFLFDDEILKALKNEIADNLLYPLPSHSYYTTCLTLRSAVKAHEEALKVYKIAQFQVICETEAEEKKHDKILEDIKKSKEPVISDLRKQELEKEKRLDKLKITHQVLNLVGKYIDDSFFIDNFADGLFTLREIIFDREQIKRVKDPQSALRIASSKNSSEHCVEMHEKNILYYMIYLYKKGKHPNILTLLENFLPKFCELGLDINTANDGRLNGFGHESRNFCYSITPFFLSVKCNMPEIARVMLENGADLYRVRPMHKSRSLTVVQMSFLPQYDNDCGTAMRLLLFEYAVKFELEIREIACFKYKDLISTECKAFVDKFHQCYNESLYGYVSEDAILDLISSKIEEIRISVQREIYRLEKEKAIEGSLAK